MMKNKIISAVLVLSMVMGLVSMAGPSAFATDTANSSQPMAMGMSGVESRSITPDGTNNATVTNEGDKIVMGTYTSDGTEYPVTWVRLNDSNLMLSEYVLEKSAFESDGSGYYSQSDNELQAVMKKLYDSGLGLTGEEKALVTETTLAKSSMYDMAWELTGQRFFPLSGDEDGNGEFWDNVGKGSDLARAISIGGDGVHNTYWWLRTSNTFSTAISVRDNGSEIIRHAIYNSDGVRPAFNLDTSDVLFTSAAENGKSGTVSNAPSVVSGTAPTTWKMTLSDTNRSAFAIGTTAVSGNTYTVAYSGATTGTNEYISAIIVDGSNNITHYGKVKALPNPSDTNGTVTINVNIPSGSTLKIFNEEANGDNKTDYSSPLLNMSTSANACLVTNTLTNITSSNLNTIHTLTSDYSVKLTANAGYVLPQAITVLVGNATLTSGQYTYTQATGNLTIPQANIVGNIEITARALVVNNLQGVTQSDITYGTVVNPQVAYSSGTTTNGGAVVIEYKKQSEPDTAYTTTKPQYAGDYTIRATSAATASTAQGVVTDNFSITAVDQTPTVTSKTVTSGQTVDLKAFLKQANANVKGDVTLTMPVGSGGTFDPTTNKYTAPSTPDQVTFELAIAEFDVNKDGTDEYNAYNGGNFTVVVPHEIVKGGGQTINRGQDIIVTSNANFDSFESLDITLEGTATPITLLSMPETSNDNASVENGSIVATINGSYTSTLPLGTHTVSINLVGGAPSATTQITIAAPGADAPETGDNTNMTLYIVIGLIALGGIGAVLYRRKMVK